MIRREVGVAERIGPAKLVAERPERAGSGRPEPGPAVSHRAGPRGSRSTRAAPIALIEHEPSIACRHEASIGTFKAGLGNDHRIIRMTTFALEPIGWVQSARTEPIDDDWGEIVARVQLDEARFTADSLRGLDAFSHVEACARASSWRSTARC